MQYRFAVLGCGHIGKKHAALANRYGKLVAVADTERKKARNLSQIYQIPAYNSLGELLSKEQIDIVVVCTPNGLHGAHSQEAIKAGMHVLCEKPMALSSRDAAQMIATAKLFNKRLFVVKQNRFNPPVLWAHGLLKENRLGKLAGFQMNAFWNRTCSYFNQSAWRGGLELDGGPLFTQFSHFVDLLYWYLGPLDRVLYACGENRMHQGCIEFEDQGSALLEFKGGIRGSLQYSLNAFEKNMEGSLTIFGEKGTIKIGGTYLNEISYLDVEGVSLPEFPPVSSNEYQGYQGSSSQHHLVYEAMLKALENPDHPVLEPEEASQSVQIIEAIYSKMGNLRY